MIHGKKKFLLSLTKCDDLLKVNFFRRKKIYQKIVIYHNKETEQTDQKDFIIDLSTKFNKYLIKE